MPPAPPGPPGPDAPGAANLQPVASAAIASARLCHFDRRAEVCIFETLGTLTNVAGASDVRRRAPRCRALDLNRVRRRRDDRAVRDAAARATARPASTRWSSLLG